MSKSLKLLILIISIAFINIIVLSPGLLGIQLFGESALQTASATAILTASILTLLYGIYQLFFKPTAMIPIKELTVEQDYVIALNHYKNMKMLKKEISFALEQVQRLKKKKDSLWNVLNQRFEPNEISYKKFITAIIEVEKLFYLNLRNILNKVSIFDETEYKHVIENNTNRFTEKILLEKAELYKEYTTFINNSLNINEEILLDLDKLLLEISKLNSFEIEDIDNMACMKEIENLIKQTKLYKQ